MSEAKHVLPTSIPAAIPASIPGSIPAAIPTWGYHATQGARLFALSPGARLPAGWADAPHAGQHPHDAERAIDEPVAAGQDVASAPPARRRSRQARKRQRVRAARSPH